MLHEKINRTLEKFFRDLLVNLVVALPLMVVDGNVKLELLAPTLGMVLWRTIRDVLPAAYRGARSE